ncbi:hypothetical protein CC80DRAFT_510420 [Byssothecium circinans]|uniref:Uncharacterized protein n=1 Tax=Byssothecium circinans TaxID=147558 RepID=A0A6A5TFR7_9PLEO|nr:hypothetical protein CC80DRAFT_510420 [Byssothecium circinans]
MCFKAFGAFSFKKKQEQESSHPRRSPYPETPAAKPDTLQPTQGPSNMNQPDKYLSPSLPSGPVLQDISTWPADIRAAVERSEAMNDKQEVWQKNRDAGVTWEVYEAIDSTNSFEEEVKGTFGFLLHEANEFAAKTFLFGEGYECAKAQGTLDQVEVELTNGVLRIEARTHITSEEVWVVGVRPKDNSRGPPPKKQKTHHGDANENNDGKDSDKDGGKTNVKRGSNSRSKAKAKKAEGEGMELDAITPAAH